MKRAAPAERFLRGRVLMRVVLGHYLAIDPAEVSLAQSASGKPRFAEKALQFPSFSLSHAGDETVLAVATGGDIGIDIESTARAAAVERISRRFFSAAEQDFLASCGARRSSEALMLWCLKESVVKAFGQSVWDGLRAASFSIAEDRIDVLSLPHRYDKPSILAAGRLSDTHVIAFAAVGLESGRVARPVFRLFRTGDAPFEAREFVPDLLG